jgi:hypothetical protein
MLKLLFQLLERKMEYEKILQRNNTYIEPEKIKGEENRRAQEPIGDWQSMSDHLRWAQLNKELMIARLTHNIRKLGKEEREIDVYLLEKAYKELHKNLSDLHEKHELYPIAEKTCCQSLYTFLTGFLNQHDRDILERKIIEEEIERVGTVMESINVQLQIYRF